MSPIATMHSVVLDCPVPEQLASFYRHVLGGTITPEEGDWVDLSVEGFGSLLSFQRSPGYVPPQWPSDDGQQQVHLDVQVDDLEVAHEQLLGIGASFIESHETFWVYRDPVGHPFCTVLGD